MSPASSPTSPPDPARAAVPLLELSGIGMRYGAVEALAGVQLALHPGEVLALCGDNGAGKSSLVRIVSGAQQPSAGELRLDGRPVRFRGPQDALAQGVATIYQDLAVAPRLSIAENIFLGSELTRGPLGLLDRRAMAAQSRGFLARLGIDLADMTTPVERLSGGQRQAVALCRALRWNARLIILDEPTAALGVKETALVLDLIRRLHAEGRTVLLVSHAMQDVVAVAERVVILKAGRKVIDRALGTTTAAELAALITGDTPRAAA
jgi:ABC-type sugar transport system ATPase subunit